MDLLIIVGISLGLSFLTGLIWMIKELSEAQDIDEDLYYRGTHIMDYDEWYDENSEWLYQTYRYRFGDNVLAEKSFYQTALDEYKKYLDELEVEIAAKKIKYEIK